MFIILTKIDPAWGQNILNNLLPLLTTAIIITTLISCIDSLYHKRWLDILKTIACSAIILVFMANTEMFYQVGEFIIKSGVKLIEK